MRLQWYIAGSLAGLAYFPLVGLNFFLWKLLDPAFDKDANIAVIVAFSFFTELTSVALASLLAILLARNKKVLAFLLASVIMLVEHILAGQLL